MQVSLGSVTVEDEYRRWVAHYYGNHRKLATRFDVRWHYNNFGISRDEEMEIDYQECVQCHPEIEE